MIIRIIELNGDDFYASDKDDGWTVCNTECSHRSRAGLCKWINIYWYSTDEQKNVCIIEYLYY